jgi:antitoxin YefM
MAPTVLAGVAGVQYFGNLAVEDYESLMETLEILSDPRARADIRRAEEAMSGGEVYDEAQVRAALAARRR